MSELATRHVPVLYAEVLEHLALADEDALETEPMLLLDCTLGGGGHSYALLEQEPRFFLVGLDQDSLAIARSAERLACFAERTLLIRESFRNAKAAIDTVTSSAPGFQRLGDDAPFARILIDLGISSDQLDDPERGFSFAKSGPLDMRMNTSAGKTAADICNTYDINDLRRVFLRGGVGSMSQALAKEIVNRRPITTTSELADICRDVARRIPAERKKDNNKATVPFQALRIEVNDELGAIEAFLEQVPSLLAPAGKLAVISFHSLEDKVVAQQMRSWSTVPRELLRLPQPGTPPSFGKLLTKQAVTPTESEIAQNPRSRSARMRVFRRNDPLS